MFPLTLCTNTITAINLLWFCSKKIYCGPPLASGFEGEISFTQSLQLVNICSTKQTKQLDGNLPSELEKFLSNNQGVDVVVKLGEENSTDQDPHPSVETQEATMVITTLTLSQ